jgi:riboflavin biosynthesis pyrimidine reductase
MKVGVVSHVAASGPGAIDPNGAFLHDGAGRVLVCTSDRTDEDAVAMLETQGAQVVALGTDRVDLAACLAVISELGVRRLMVEGGGTLVAALLEADLVDELQLAVAPLLFGGSTAPTPVGGIGWDRDAAIELELIETSTSADAEVILRYRVHGVAGR